MATITFGVSSSTVTGSKSFTLSDADIARFIAAYKPRYGAGNQSNAQVLLSWAEELMNTVKQTVLAAEQAAQAATVTPITVT